MRTDDLSKNKRATQSKTYLSPTNAYIAENVVDRDVTTCMRTEPIGVNSPDKTVWWKVDLGGVYNIYSLRTTKDMVYFYIFDEFINDRMNIGHLFIRTWFINN